ncbi:helix-turn-helix transcriptional regulator [Streptomyces cinereoruber]|uniref:helix-turn-helix transcriptional regulator n=1 Tax=Streptomyces cinereoruber TaxID=67260 RepID=UPI00362F3963
MNVDRQALKTLLAERRALVQPAEHGFPRPRGKGRRAAGLSQQQVDELTDRPIGTYYRLEAGRFTAAPSTDYLRAVGQLFGLNEQEWWSLHRYVGLGDPPGPLYETAGLEVPGVWQEAVDGFGHPAYLTDARWNFLAWNKAFAELFPSNQVPTNAMRWMLLDPAARRMLLQWETAWAPLVLPQLRAALAQRPDDPVLSVIARDAATDPHLRLLWDTGGAHIHPDGDERPIHHAIHGPGHVTMCAAQPLTAPGSRLIVLIYHPGPNKQHTRLPMLRAPQD